MRVWHLSLGLFCAGRTLLLLIGLIGRRFFRRGLFFDGFGRKDKFFERSTSVEDFEEITFKQRFVGGETNFTLELFQALHEQLADVSHAEGVLALDAAS